jgi:hypothetical protein
MESDIIWARRRARWAKYAADEDSRKMYEADLRASRRASRPQWFMDELGNVRSTAWDVDLEARLNLNPGNIED